jgi:putative heme iron utilization protein
MAHGLGGHPDATEATCVRIDRYGLDLALKTPRGHAETRIAFAETANQPGDLRAATVELARRARG